MRVSVYVCVCEQENQRGHWDTVPGHLVKQRLGVGALAIYGDILLHGSVHREGHFVTSVNDQYLHEEDILKVAESLFKAKHFNPERCLLIQ